MERINISQISKKSILLLSILIFSAFQTLPKLGLADNRTQGTDVTLINQTPVDQVSVEDMTNVDSMLGITPSGSEATQDVLQPIDSVKNRYMNTIPTDTTSQGSISQTDLPNYLYTWSDFSSNYTNVLKSPFLKTYQDAIVKVNSENQIETLVKVSTTQLTPEITALFEKYHVKIISTYSILAIYKVNVDARLLDAFINDAQAISGINYVQPSYYYSTSYVPNDPQWINQYGPQIIGMESAWDTQLGDPSVLVAIVDTGIDYTHEDLGNYVPLGYDWINNDADPMDDNGHGTHVAGTIGATIGNGIGIAGIADVSFFAEKFLDAGGYGSDIDGANAIIHATDMGANIISNSWGGYGDSQVLDDAVNYAISNGAIVVAAAGNGATNSLFFPAAIPDVIAVTATDMGDNFAFFSNYGDWVDIAAPGVDILSTVPWGYDYFSGTSMATPHVSGLLALLKSQFPGYTNVQLENLLFSTAVDLGAPGFDDHFGWGRIDASIAIQGLQEFNVRASLSADPVIPYNLPSQFVARVTNIGFSDLTDVSLSLAIDGSIVTADTAVFLASGESYDLPYQYFPPGVGTHDVTVTVDPVPGETVLGDNQATKTVTASAPLINPIAGSVLTYTPVGSDYPFDLKWVVTDTSNPLAYLMDFYIFDPQAMQEFWVDTYSLNIYTREYSSIYFQESGYLFPYWVQTDLQLGQAFDLFILGGQDAVVIDETTIDYYGVQVPVWVVDDGFELAFFNKADGILVALKDYNYNPTIYDLSFTNSMSDGANLHNLRTKLNSKTHLTVGQTSNVLVFVQNTGVFGESTTSTLSVNSEFVGSYDIFLGPGEYTFLSFSYTPQTTGDYDLQTNIVESPDGTYWADDYDEKFLTLLDLINYGLSNPQYSWYDAVANGFNLGLYGDDVSTALDLPFSFRFYDQAFSTIYVSSNAWMSFVDTDPSDPYSPGIPNDIFPYSIALFWDNLMAEGNVWVWATPDFVAIQYDNYNYVWGEFAGTFEVVLFSTGEILMQYQNVATEYQAVKGINYGYDSTYYGLIPDNLSGMSQYAALFTPGGAPEGPDIKVGFTLPDFIEPNMPATFEVYAQNIGGANAEYVNVFVRINGEDVATGFDSLLKPNEVLSFSFEWTPPYEGQFSLHIETSPVPGETNTNNNIITTNFLAGGYHDLQVEMDIYPFNGNFLIDARVFNYGQTPESNVELYIYVEGHQVAFAISDNIDTFEFMSLTYILAFPDRPVEITALTPVRPNEDDTTNNMVVKTFDPTPNALLEFQVFDSVTGDPLENAFIMINGASNSYFGATNSTGGFSIQVAADDYFIAVDLYPYIEFQTWITVNNGDSLSIPVPLLLPTGNERAHVDLYVSDYVTHQPLEGVQINITQGDFNVVGYTDFNGYFSTDVPLGDVTFEFSKDGYITATAVWFFNIPDGYFGFGLDMRPNNGPPQELYILSPTENQVVEGGLVHIYYDSSDPWDINTIDIYVNDIFVSTVLFDPSMTFFVPVTSEGMNNISLRANFGSGQVAWTSVDIETINLVPYMSMVIGDFYNFRFDVPGTPHISVDFDLTVTDIVSDHEVRFNLDYSYYENDALVLHDTYYLVVDLYSGLVVDSDMWWLGMHFYILSGLPNPQSAQIGDSFPFWFWNDVMTITGSGVWNGQETWVFTNFWGDTVGEVLKDNGLFIDYNLANVESGQVVSTSLIPGLVPPPSVTDAPDQVNELGSTGNSLTWTATSDLPTTYEIYKDGTLIDSGTWVSGQEFTVITDETSTGVHFYEIYVYDQNGDFAYDSVNVTIVDTTPPTVTTPDPTEYEYGTTGNVIVITAFDYQPNNYSVFRDGDFVGEGTWQNDQPIEINIDGLEPGTYHYTIWVMDLWGNGVDVSVDVVVVDTTPPTLRSMPDFTYEVGSIDNYIRWTASDDLSGTYQIYLDGGLIAEGDWTASNSIEINIDGLAQGRYNFTAVFFDTYANSRENTVIVYVLPSQDNLPHGVKKLPGFESWIAMFALVAIPIIRKKRLNK